jgi:hypothetical protein
VDQFSSAAPAKQPQAGAATRSRNLKDLPADKTQLSTPSAGALARDNLDDARALDRIATKANIANGAPAEQRKEQAQVNSSMAAGPVPAPPPPPAEVARPLAQARANAAGQAGPAATEMSGSVSQSVTVTEAAPEVPRSTSQSVTVTGAAPAVETTTSSLGELVNQQKVTDLPMNGRDYTDLALLKAKADNSILVKSPSGKILWNAGMGGRIERSTDSGKKWSVQTSPVHEDWLAGAALSDAVCWLVGRNGAIVQTTNGKSWKRIVSPTQAAVSGKLPDWIEVTASSAQAATITARDQRRFTTQDGGKTWQLQ